MKVRAVKDSIVLVAKPDNGTDYGNRIYLKHDDGFISMYGHLKHFDIVVGQELKAGEEFAEIGSSGYCPSGAHLHYSLFAPGTPKLYASNTIDPSGYLRQHGYPCDTVMTNPYGSPHCNPKLDGHEGIDFSSYRLKK